jgi:predicted sulfurtransferase
MVYLVGVQRCVLTMGGVGTRTTEFADTEFKLIFEVVKLVNYGLAGSRAPQLAKHVGTHLEPQEYHAKMCESDTVIIDVRNHYEAKIGHFDPPTDGA